VLKLKNGIHSFIVDIHIQLYIYNYAGGIAIWNTKIM